MGENPNDKTAFELYSEAQGIPTATIMAQDGIWECLAGFLHDNPVFRRALGIQFQGAYKDGNEYRPTVKYMGESFMVKIERIPK